MKDALELQAIGSDNLHLTVGLVLGALGVEAAACWHFLSRYRVCDDLGNNLRIAYWRSVVQSLEMRAPNLSY